MRLDNNRVGLQLVRVHMHRERPLELARALEELLLRALRTLKTSLAFRGSSSTLAFVSRSSSKMYFGSAFAPFGFFRLSVVAPTDCVRVCNHKAISQTYVDPKPDDAVMKHTFCEL
jgi:hypothetical protein